MYYAWLLHTYPDEPVYPLTESKLYAYACECRQMGQSASRVDTLLGTLKYVGEAFKFPGAIDSAGSERVKGASHQMILTRQPRSRADMLVPTMLCWLEIACFSVADDYDRMIAGLCLFCCYGRLRCSDANRTRHGTLIGRFFEGALSRTKTAKSKEKATSFIPLIVPSFGLLGKPWFLEFVKARSNLGLRDIPSLESQAHDLDFVLVPEKGSLGYETQNPIGSVELTDRLLSLLGSGFSQDDLYGIRSHSLKATLLAWMNTWGCDLTTSELLGYHVNKEHSSALNYIRDCLSEPIRRLVDMMKQVHDGVYVPGAARDSLFPPALQRKPLTRQFLEKTGLDVLDAARIFQEDAWFPTTAAMREDDGRFVVLKSQTPFPDVGLVEYLKPTEEFPLRGLASSDDLVSDDSSSSDSSDSTAKSDCEFSHAYIDAYHEGSAGGLRGRAIPAEKSDTLKVYRHSRTRMLHYGHVDHSDRTGCGRAISEAYYVYKSDPDAAFPKCKVCFGSVQV